MLLELTCPAPGKIPYDMLLAGRTTQRHEDHKPSTECSAAIPSEVNPVAEDALKIKQKPAPGIQAPWFIRVN